MRKLCIIGSSGVRSILYHCLQLNYMTVEKTVWSETLGNLQYRWNEGILGKDKHMTKNVLFFYPGPQI